MKRIAILIFVFAVTVVFVTDAEGRNFRRAKVRTRAKASVPAVEVETVTENTPDAQMLLDTALEKLRDKTETVPPETAALDEWNRYVEKQPKPYSDLMRRGKFCIEENDFDADTTFRAWQDKPKSVGHLEFLTASDAKRAETVLANIRDNAENKHPERILAETQYATGMIEYLAPNTQRESPAWLKGYFIGSFFR